MSRKISLGFSSCPNDTYIFDAMVNRKIPTSFQYQVVMADVEELNQLAQEGALDVTKLSYSALFKVEAQYHLLQSGSALGKSVGPLLISKQASIPKPTHEWKVILPGKLTTAHLLFSLAYPDVRDKSFCLFSEIEDALLDGKYDAGVIIHENRFTYQQKGLSKIQDLGDFWEHHYKVPIPLGGIAAHKRINPENRLLIEKDIRNSILFAFNHPDSSNQYVALHAQEMDANVRRQHIETYVNQFSQELGSEGLKAIEALRVASKAIH